MVTIYSKPNCPNCESAKQYLSTLNIRYEVRDITKDTMAHSFLVREGHRSVPQFYLGTELAINGGYAGLLRMDADEIRNQLGEINVTNFEI